MYLEVETPAMGSGTFFTYGFGNALVKQAEIEIGGQLIDRQYGNWMNIWTELTVPEGKRAGYDDMVGNKATSHSQTGSINANAATRFYVPLQFWFNRNPGLALPLIALQYHEVKLNLELRPASELTNGADSTATGLGCKLYVDYIYLDTDERRRFAQVSHEYLIEQVQYNNGVSAKEDVQTELRFNHPVKELIWQTRGAGSDCCNFNTGVDGVCSALLQLNGHDRFRKRTGEHFSTVQRYEHHSGSAGDWAVTSLVDAGTIYSYSFALKPEEHQPSGTCNFSRIDNAVLNLGIIGGRLTDNNTAALDDANAKAMAKVGVLDVYAVNYNVLRIMSGMGGLAYSN